MARKPVKVSQLNGYIKRVLQTDPALGDISVIGEISNLKYHSSGHVYFSLKDEGGRLSCFMPRDALQGLRFELHDGLEAVAEGYVSVYERGGTYSLTVRAVEVEGAGGLAAAFEQLKAKLAGEGLFDESFKKPLPFFPRSVAVVTSGTGAAVHDILKTIAGRNDWLTSCSALSMSRARGRRPT
jgi:exodeoxyribonuclease VII large subunit